MKEKLKNIDQHKFVTWLSGPIAMLVYSIGVTILWYYLIFINDEKFEIWKIIVFHLMFFIFPWMLTLWIIKLCFAIVTIDEGGIDRKLFGFMFKRYISWEELYEIRVLYVPTGGAWIFFSKKSLERMSIGKARSQKGQIQVEFSKKLLEVIFLYTDREIVNLPKSQIEKILGRKKENN